MNKWKQNPHFFKNIRSWAFLLILLLLVASWLTGCSQSPEKKSEPKRWESKIVLTKPPSDVEERISNSVTLRIYKKNVAIFLILTYIIIFAVFFRFMIDPILKVEKNRKEQAIRILALMTGFLLYFTIRFLFYSYPKWLYESVNMLQKMNLLLYGGIIPLCFSTIVGFVITFNLKTHSNLAYRINILVASFVFTLFIEMLVYAVAAGGTRLPSLLTPNLTFVVGIVLFFVLFYRKNPDSEVSPENPETTSNEPT